MYKNDIEHVTKQYWDNFNPSRLNQAQAIEYYIHQRKPAIKQQKPVGGRTGVRQAKSHSMNRH